jgi:hypothetical protein
VNGLCILDGEIKRQAEVGYLCGWHRDRLDFLSSEIAILWCELALILDGSAPREWTEKTQWKKLDDDIPAPLDLEAATLRMTIPAQTASWTLLVATERPITASLPKSLVAQLDLMQRHHDWIAAQAWIDDYANWLEQTRKLMRRTVRDWIGQILGTCDWPDTSGHPCGGRIMRENGTETVRCNKCGRVWESGRRVVC